ncbi:hypothetical protein [Methylobacillus flagellatus]|uniref:hypothetical protein n=1 Tax=Methylobacillus flagellatus TaxID=405 RepID=UPI0010F78E98|nr:hypothetical protein [Methylobacillus flagellatus]
MSKQTKAFTPKIELVLRCVFRLMKMDEVLDIIHTAYRKRERPTGLDQATWAPPILIDFLRKIRTY